MKDPQYVIDTTPLRDPEAIAARDAAWLEKVYDPSDPQLTIRAALTGMLLGGILSASNLYIGLKIGWSFGMGITASVVGFAIFAGLRAAFPKMTPFTMLENNTSQTAASAAAYMSSAGLVSSIPAMTMLRNEGVIAIPELKGWMLTAWMLGISVLGVVVAIPLKRNMINAEQLRFPQGIVCAETIKTMHAAGRESMSRARSLLYAALVAGSLKLALGSRVWLFKKIPEVVAFPGKLRGYALSAWPLGANTSLLLYAAGAIVGLKVAASLLVGALVNYGLIGPWLLDHGVLRVADASVAKDPAAWGAFAKAAEAAHAIPIKIPDAIHGTIRSKWSVWPGTAIMVAASLTAFAFRWQTVVRAFRGLGGAFSRKKSADPLEPVEVPSSWFAIGLVACTVACVIMQWAWFQVPILEGIVSVIAAFLLSVVAARVTGETGITPIGAMGKITQLLFGVMVPGNAAANLMTATVTAGAASHSADLLSEVKTGYLLGGSPRKQFWAQMLGVVAGSAVCVPVYFLIADPTKVGKELAAPAAVAWASVAKLLKDGVQNLPMYAKHGIVIGVAIGVVIAVLDELAARANARAKERAEKAGEKPPPPAAWTQWIPNATGLGIALVIDANDSIAMFTGALFAWYLALRHKQLSERYTVSVASGMTAGEGLMGILVIFLRDVLHWLPS